MDNGNLQQTTTNAGMVHNNGQENANNLEQLSFNPNFQTNQQSFQDENMNFSLAQANYAQQFTQDSYSNQQNLESDNGKGQSIKSGNSDKDKGHTSSQDDEDPAIKRQRFLERNRIAASKCRQKKKAWMNQLASQADQAAARNKALQMMVNQLKDEVLVLKNQLLAHRNCSCNVIQQYIQTSGQFATMNVRPPAVGLPQQAAQVQHQVVQQPMAQQNPSLMAPPQDQNNA